MVAAARWAAVQSGSPKATGSDLWVKRYNIASCALRAPGQQSSPGHPKVPRGSLLSARLGGTVILTKLEIVPDRRYNLNMTTETIVALSTPPGVAALAVIRLSGPD